MAQYSLIDPEFGDMTLTVRSNSRGITARWKGETLHLSIPYGVSVKQIRESLDNMRDGIRRLKKPVQHYHLGDKIMCFKHSVTITTHNRKQKIIEYGGNDNNLEIKVRHDFDLSSAEASNAISCCLERLMAMKAEESLIPFAADIARKVKAPMVKGFVIGRGKRKLGHCTSQRIIQLSHNLMFYPDELVELVVCHELAHLTHMNHSAQFHALCNSYLDGREAELEHKLKNFRIPLYR